MNSLWPKSQNLSVTQGHGVSAVQSDQRDDVEDSMSGTEDAGDAGDMHSGVANSPVSVYSTESSDHAALGSLLRDDANGSQSSRAGRGGGANDADGGAGPDIGAGLGVGSGTGLAVDNYDRSHDDDASSRASSSPPVRAHHTTPATIDRAAEGASGVVSLSTETVSALSESVARALMAFMHTLIRGPAAPFAAQAGPVQPPAIQPVVLPSTVRHTTRAAAPASLTHVTGTGEAAATAALPGPPAAPSTAPFTPLAADTPYKPCTEPTIILYPSEIATYIEPDTHRVRRAAMGRVWQRSHPQSFQETFAAWSARGRKPRKWTSKQVTQLVQAEQQQLHPNGGGGSGVAGTTLEATTPAGTAAAALLGGSQAAMSDPFPSIASAADVEQFMATRDARDVQRLCLTKGKQMEATIASEFERAIEQPLSMRNTAVYWARGMDSVKFGSRCQLRPIGHPIIDPGPYALSGELDACLTVEPFLNTPVEFKLRMTRIPDAIPMQDLLQVQAYMAMMDAKQAFHVQMLFGTTDLTINVVKRDVRFWDQVRPKLDAFVCDIRKLMRGAPEDEQLRHEVLWAWEVTAGSSMSLATQAAHSQLYQREYASRGSGINRPGAAGTHHGSTQGTDRGSNAASTLSPADTAIAPLSATSLAGNPELATGAAMQAPAARPQPRISTASKPLVDQQQQSFPSPSARYSGSSVAPKHNTVDNLSHINTADNGGQSGHGAPVTGRGNTCTGSIHARESTEYVIHVPGDGTETEHHRRRGQHRAHARPSRDQAVPFPWPLPRNRLGNDRGCLLPQPPLAHRYDANGKPKPRSASRSAALATQKPSRRQIIPHPRLVASGGPSSSSPEGGSTDFSPPVVVVRKRPRDGDDTGNDGCDPRSADKRVLPTPADLSNVSVAVFATVDGAPQATRRASVGHERGRTSARSHRPEREAKRPPKRRHITSASRDRNCAADDGDNEAPGRSKPSKRDVVAVVVTTARNNVGDKPVPKKLLRPGARARQTSDATGNQFSPLHTTQGDERSIMEAARAVQFTSTSKRRRAHQRSSSPSSSARSPSTSPASSVRFRASSLDASASPLTASHSPSPSPQSRRCQEPPVHLRAAVRARHARSYASPVYRNASRRASSVLLRALDHALRGSRADTATTSPESITNDSVSPAASTEPEPDTEHDGSEEVRGPRRNAKQSDAIAGDGRVRTRASPPVRVPSRRHVATRNNVEKSHRRRDESSRGQADRRAKPFTSIIRTRSSRRLTRSGRAR